MFLTKKLHLVGAFLILGQLAWAGSDMSSTSYRIRRSDVNSGGSSQPTSASYKMIDTTGSGGGSLFSGTTYFVFSGFSSIVSHPDSIEDLAVVTGASPDQLVLSWTAPTAYASTGTATSYAVRFSTTLITTELDFVNAGHFNNAWVPQAPGALEVRTLSSLSSNTTYYFAVKGADQAGNTGYLSNKAGASTLTDAVSGIQIIDVGVSSVTLSWTGLGTGNAEGYLVQASTMADFSGVVRSSATTDGNQTTLTVKNLRAGKLTYFRVGGLNWAGAANFVSGVSTVTLPGPPPANPTLVAVYQSSITIQWGAVAADDGYSAEASTDATFGAIAGSSITIDSNASQLTIQGLLANAVYDLRVGSLYDNATNYAFVTPLSTVTLPAVPAPALGAFTMVGVSSLTAAWGAGINAPGTQYQVEVSTISSGGLSTSTVVTLSLAATFTGLQQDTTYWAQVKAIGISGTDSAYLTIGSTITMILPPQGVQFTDIELSSVTVGWISGGSNLTYNVDMAPADPFGIHLTSATTNASAIFSGLGPDSLYSARVQAQSLSTGHFSAYSLVVSSYTLAEPPLTLSTAAVNLYSATLVWDGNGNPATALYAVERSTDGTAFIQVSVVRAARYVDLTLAPGTHYAYRVRALNENGIPTVYSNVLSILTTGSPTSPREPTGFTADRQRLSGTQWQITYRWHAVTKRTDGSALGVLAGYQLYKSASLLTPRSQWTLVSTLPSETWTETTDGSVTYYCWKTIDGAGLLSDWSVVMDDSADLNHIYPSFDNITRLVIPETASDILRSDKNRYGADLRIEWAEWSSEETGRVVRSMQAKMMDVETDGEITDLLFTQAVVRGVIAYNVLNGQVVAGAPDLTNSGNAPFGSPKAPIINVSDAAQQLSLFWYNGAEWVKTSGLVNSTDNTVSFTGTRTGRFQIRAATHAPGVTLTRVYPRIITPNGDGWNDKAIFQFDNPQQSALSGKVFDISGAAVANLQPGPNPDTSLAWDGKDSGGKPVPGGIYIYEVDIAGGSPMTGTLVVAR